MCLEFPCYSVAMAIRLITIAAGLACCLGLGCGRNSEEFEVEGDLSEGGVAISNESASTQDPSGLQSDGYSNLSQEQKDERWHSLANDTVSNPPVSVDYGGGE